MRFDINGKTPFAEGGEGVIYEYGEKSVVKIYKQHIDLVAKQQKVETLIKANLPKEVIKPTDCVFDRKQRFIGMVMPKVNGEDFKRLSNKKFVTSNNINTKDILEMLDRLWNVLQELHNQNIYIGDLNDQNILFNPKTKDIFIIDTDSWSIGSQHCEVAMDLFKDPKLVGDNFNAETDTYAFCVLAWKSLTRVHPFGGTTSPDMQIIDRINKGLSVIDNPKVKIPKIAKSWRNLSPNLVDDFKNVFNFGNRKFGNNISYLLQHLTYCKVDNDYYFSDFNTCPICNAAAKVISKATSIGVENGFKVVQILETSDIKTVYSDNVYLNMNDEVVNIKTGKKVPYCGARCLFDKNGNVIICYKDYMQIGEARIPIKFNSYPVLDGNSIYYLSDQEYLCKLEVMPGGIGKENIQKCSSTSYFNVVNGKYCLVNIYDKKIIVNIDGYYYTLDFAKQVRDCAAHYDVKLDRWLIIIEDNSSVYHTYILDKNILKWSSDKINYKCPVYNVCFDNGAIYIPLDDAIRGLNVKTLQYKDFTCDAVSSDSMLIKNGGQFIIINDDNIYRFYK